MMTNLDQSPRRDFLSVPNALQDIVRCVVVSKQQQSILIHGGRMILLARANDERERHFPQGVQRESLQFCLCWLPCRSTLKLKG